MSPMVDSRNNRSRQLKRALDNLRNALEEFESAMVEFEEELAGEQQHVRPQSGKGLDLLSIPEVCQELGMGKSWVYQRIRSGEIPSVKLGGKIIKVRRQDLEAYLQSQTYHPQEDEELLPEEGEDQPPS